MRGRKTIAIISVAMTFLSLSFYLFAKGAGSAIPRSSVLNGAKKSPHGDTNILLLGLDSRRDNNGNNLPRKLLNTMHVGSSSAIGGYNTNTMILIHIPADGSHAVAISIPRDDYVDVAGFGPQKIKEAYGLAKYSSEIKLIKAGIQNPEREKQSRDVGRALTISTVATLLNVPIDHFAEVNLVGFYDLANAIGGVQVCLNHAVNDAKYSGAILPAGLQTITGTQALAFVRQRHGLPNGDLDRTHRQQAFITGVITKFRTQGLFGDLGKLKSLLGVAQKDVVIDTGWDVLSFLPQAKALTGGRITFHTLPIEGYAMRNSQSVNLIDIPTVQKFTQDLFYPKPKASSSPTPSASPSASKKSAPAKPFNYAHLANGGEVNGAGIPCVN
jgi:LCP family protein required for cell wall assembly